MDQEMSRNAKVKKQMGQRANWGKKYCKSILGKIGMWNIDIKQLLQIYD